MKPPEFFLAVKVACGERAKVNATNLATQFVIEELDGRLHRGARDPSTGPFEQQPAKTLEIMRQPNAPAAFSPCHH